MVFWREPGGSAWWI